MKPGGKNNAVEIQINQIRDPKFQINKIRDPNPQNQNPKYM